MNAFLYTWSSWEWIDFYDAILRVNTGDFYDTKWSCGRRKNSVAIKDRFFLTRIGKKTPHNQKGIIGCGYITSTPYQDEHYKQDKIQAGELALYTDIVFSALSDRPIIDLDTLRNDYPKINWTPEQSGMSLELDVAEKLFAKIGGYGHRPHQWTEDEVTRYVEGKPKTITVTTYDRSTKARQACIQAHGYSCAACGFNFSDKYGQIGQTYIQVHHLRQLADIGNEYVIDPVNDLRPVCANCHCMLHLRKPAYSIDELQAKLKTAPPP